MKEKNQVVPDEVLSKEFLSQFKTEADVSKFLKQLHAQVLEKMLEGEMDAHLGYEKNSVTGNNTGNSRNGSYPKKIQTEHGESVISIPRDRNGQFEPIAVPKHESRGLSIEKLVISLYAKGMSVSDIEEEMREIYEIELSTSAISIITNKVNQAAQEWQNRPLDPVYLIVWMDGIVFKVRDNGKIINKTVYLCVGLKQNGLKEVLGMWVGKSESSSFWMGVLTDLKARGVQDILITCTDNLNGFTDTIRSIFPQSSTQICVVHQIRNSCKYVVYKDKKEFTADMKNIYNAPNKEVAAAELDNLEKKWGGKYPFRSTKVSMGNPHLVTFVEDITQINLPEIGPELENHPLFPDRTNVEFAQIVSKDTIRMRVWERGSGITQACGTGACATAVAAFINGLTGRKSDVIMDGGTVTIEWDEISGHILMTGPATKVFDGEIEDKY